MKFFITLFCTVCLFSASSFAYSPLKKDDCLYDTRYGPSVGYQIVNVEKHGYEVIDLNMETNSFIYSDSIGNGEYYKKISCKRVRKAIKEEEEQDGEYYLDEDDYKKYLRRKKRLIGK